MMDDGEGVKINFKNCIILLTTNLAGSKIMEMTDYGQKEFSVQEMENMIKPDLVNHFKPALVGRMSVIPYTPLNRSNLEVIVKLKTNKIVKRFKENYGSELELSENVLEKITDSCMDVESGARNVDNIINNDLLPKLSGVILEKIAVSENIDNIRIDNDSESRDYLFINTETE